MKKGLPTFFNRKPCANWYLLRFYPIGGVSHKRFALFNIQSPACSRHAQIASSLQQTSRAPRIGTKSEITKTSPIPRLRDVNRSSCLPGNKYLSTCFNDHPMQRHAIKIACDSCTCFLRGIYGGLLESLQAGLIDNMVSISAL